MHLFVGIFSLFLTVFCGVGGVLYGLYMNLNDLQRYASYWFWVFPAMVAIQCFKEHARSRYVVQPKPKPEESDPLKPLAE